MAEISSAPLPALASAKAGAFTTSALVGQTPTGEPPSRERNPLIGGIIPEERLIGARVATEQNDARELPMSITSAPQSEAIPALQFVEAHSVVAEEGVTMGGTSSRQEEKRNGEELSSAREQGGAKTLPNNLVHLPSAFSKGTTQSSDGAAPREADHAVVYIAIDRILNNPKQPRQHFAEQELAELADSIRALGVLQPVVLRPAPDSDAGLYEIVAGERRWRAATRAGLLEVPAIVRHLDERETLEIALVENIQRQNLNPLEEARAYQRFADEFNFSQQQIAERVGKDRVSISNTIRLLKLPEFVQALLRDEKISTGHAKAILTVKEPAAQINLAKKVVGEGLSVRELEAIVSRVVVLDGGKTRAKGEKTKGANLSSGAVSHIADKLRNALGTKVIVKHHKSGRGKVIIEYFSDQELDRILDVVCG